MSDILSHSIIPIHGVFIAFVCLNYLPVTFRIMKFELIAAVEPCFAFKTFIKFEIDVPSFVVFSIAIGYELFVTEIACKWFFSSVDA